LNTTHQDDNAVNLSNCAQEPIHRPGAIQPYGAVLVVDAATLEVLEAAITRQIMREEYGTLLGEHVGSIFNGFFRARCEELERLKDGQSLLIGSYEFGRAGAHYVLVHKIPGLLLIDMEERIPGDSGTLEELYPSIQACIAQIEQSSDTIEACAIASEYVRRLAKFDRTLIYKFDRRWNGAVIAEHRNERLPSYLGLRFPESDIPAQARELYRRNRVRLIADSHYAPIPFDRIASRRGLEPTDLGQSMLRSVSPMHLQYMRNMDTGASMSISIISEGQLWGLISCHNREPMRVPAHVRTACEFIGQILSLQIALKERALSVEQRIARRAVQVRLLGHMAGTEDFIAALGREQESLLGLTSATGAAIVHNGQCLRLGACPSVRQIEDIVQWLGNRAGQDDIFISQALGAEWAPALEFADVASGLLAISISQLHDSFVLWFRGEVVQTVEWGGDPRKGMEGQSLTPRMSFERWKETVRHQALEWDDLDRDAALELRAAIVDIVLRKAEELAELNEQLLRSNKELEAFSYSVSHDLRAPFRHIVGYSDLLETSLGDRLTDEERRYLSTIVESATSAGTLVDDLLSFSQMGRSAITMNRIDSRELVAEVIRKLSMETAGRDIHWEIGQLAPIEADPGMLGLVWQNLIANAIKFTRDSDPARIVISSTCHEEEVQFTVQDNGCGFDMRYVDKLFGVFQRLHHSDEYEGTGIGLANVARIVSRHGGRVWAESRIGQGASFAFALPLHPGTSA
jgi:light-regulated signal transduction histidine kinase (bacteriophytochrome)